MSVTVRFHPGLFLIINVLDWRWRFIFVLKAILYSMHAMLKLSLMIFVATWTVFQSPTAYSQNEPAAAAVPVISVETQPVAIGDELVVLELFSSQACVFCPKADQLFAELLKADNVIGLACHVDYFDVHTGSLARPFCTARQNWYMQALGAGPNYTPQVIVNGTTDVVGYKANDVKDAMKKGQQYPPLDIVITKGAADGDFTLAWDAASTLAKSDNAVLWLMMIDKPHDLTIAEGRNKGKQVTYVNIVSDMEDRGAWDKASQNKVIKVTLKEEHAGFAILAQDSKDGKILAAGQYRRN